MLDVLPLMRTLVMPALAFALFAGCASKAPAPAESRTPSKPVVAEVPAGPAVARPGYYIIKKGDTLYSVARQFDRSYREVASWNGIDDPNVIKVGQEVRVAPPGESLGNKPLPDSVLIESKPIPAAPGIVSSSEGSTLAVPSVSTATTAPVGQKTEPKGGRIAYSAQAWKDLQVGEKAVPGATAVSAPQAASQSQPAQSKPVSVAEDGSDWSWPNTGKILATFNDSSSKGIDIAGAVGDPVLAAGAGEVMYVGSALRGYGNLIIIKHSNNFQSVYAHNSEILVKEKQIVQKGQKIAALGSSDTDRPKLHFEIRRQGKPVDPMKYLPTR